MIPEAQTIVLIGGTVKNKGMVSALKEILQKEILVPEEPQIVNALGALKYYS
jgi:activator of 2-hydroxyglutaryl-CoA dehydratase